MNPKYEKILYMKRPESHFAKMSREARAGQFASFLASAIFLQRHGHKFDFEFKPDCYGSRGGVWAEFVIWTFFYTFGKIL